jgi:hypothetical protein
LTATVTVAVVVDGQLLVAVIVYTVEEETEVGVPVIAPVDVLNAKPVFAVISGLIEYEEGAVPVTVALLAVIGVLVQYGVGEALV